MTEASISMRRGEPNDVGLLPHEVAFVKSRLLATRKQRDEAQVAVGEANANSGGDWAFDDSATQAAAHEAVQRDRDYKIFHKLAEVADRGLVLDYPQVEDPVVAPGSRVTIRTDRGNRTIDVASRLIPGMPKDVDRDVNVVGVSSPLGSAVVGHVLGDVIRWAGPRDRQLEAQVVEVDQLAQPTFYAATVPSGE